MLKKGLFKNRNAGVNKDEQLDPTQADDSSWNSDYNDDQGHASSPMHQTRQTLGMDDRWSVAAGRGMSIFKGAGQQNLHEQSDDEDDLYTSDREDDLNDGLAEEAPEPATPRSRSKSPKTPKKKKVKKIDGSLPLEAPGTPGKLRKGKKKMKKKKSASAISASTKPEGSNREGKKKNGKAKKTRGSAATDAPTDAPPQEFSSFSEIDKLSEEADPVPKKSPKKPKKKIAKKQKNLQHNLAPSVTKMSMRSNFFNAKLYMSLKNLSDSMHGDDLDSKEKEPNSTSTETNQVDGKKLKADAVSKIKAFTIVRRRISEQKQFLDAFDEDNGKVNDEKRKQTQENLENLANELQKYENMLEVERAEMSKQKMVFQLKQESVEQMLNEEAEKNEALEMRIQELEEQLANTCPIKQVDSLTAKNKCLQNQVDILQQKTERQQETIESMASEQSQLKRKLSTGPSSDGNTKNYLVSPGALRRKKFLPPAPLTEESSVTGESVDEEEEEEIEIEQSGFDSISNLSGKAQGELLMLRSTLDRQNSVIEEQAKELAHVKHRLTDLLDEKGVQNLKQHVENLENEKKFFVAEIEKLKKANAAALAAAAETESTPIPPLPFAPPPPPQEPSTPASVGRWFGRRGAEATETVPPPPAAEPSTPSTLGRWFAMTTGKGPEADAQSHDDDAVDDFFRSKANVSLSY